MKFDIKKKKRKKEHVLRDYASQRQNVRPKI